MLKSLFTWLNSLIGAKKVGLWDKAKTEPASPFDHELDNMYRTLPSNIEVEMANYIKRWEPEYDRVFNAAINEYEFTISESMKKPFDEAMQKFGPSRPAKMKLYCLAADMLELRRMMRSI